MSVEVPKEGITVPEEPKEVKKDDIKSVEEDMEKLNVEESKKDVVEEEAKDKDEGLVHFFFQFFLV